MHARLGLDMEALGQRMIRPALTEQHRAFFAGLPTLVVGTVVDGQPWATIIAGVVRVPTETRLVVEGTFAEGDPAAPVVGGDVGLLGIELATRRRNRVNGRVVRLDASGFEVEVVQAFGNCPQYIRPRAGLPVAGAVSELTTDVAAADLAAADTCFVASWSGEGGADVSHRGGPPGFLRRDGDRIWVPDYPGNNLFMTFGNLVAHPRAGLAIPDFTRGGVVQLAGRAEVVWGPERGWWLHVEQLRGAGTED